MPSSRRRTRPRKPLTIHDLPFGPEFFKRLFDNLYDGVYFVDRRRRILFWNKGAELISGYSREEVIGNYCPDNILDHVDGCGTHLCRRSCPLVQTIHDGQPRRTRVFLRHKDGRRIAVDVHVMPLKDSEGQILGGIEVFRDASSAVALERWYAQLRVLAEKDPLTGVANRRHLDAALAEQLQLLGHTGIPFSVIMIDLDHFKAINDTWGHAVGDQALIGFAQLLERFSRGSDVPGRFGGEEFLIILPDARLEIAAQVAERLRSAAPTVTPPEVTDRRLTASFGVAEAALGDTAENLLGRADAALYRAKEGGRDRVGLQDDPTLVPSALAHSPTCRKRSQRPSDAV